MTRAGLPVIAAARGRAATAAPLARFDSGCQLVYANRAAADLPPSTLEPRGTTVLLDAIGCFITDIGRGLSVLLEEDRPARVMEWVKPTAQQLDSQQGNKYAGDFGFLGATGDTIGIGTDPGFSADRTLTCDPPAAGVAGAFASVAQCRNLTRALPAEGRCGAGCDDGGRRRVRGRS